MKKTVSIYVPILFAMAVVPSAGFAQLAPHWQANAIKCMDCHPTHMGVKTGCTFCHNNETGGGYAKNSAPYVQTHRNKACEECHNPHASSQCDTPVVEGTFSGYTLNAATTTFATDSLIVNDPSWLDSASWSEKTGPERGLIFLVEGGLWDASRTTPVYVDYSAEIVGATADSITVQGVHAGSDLTGSVNFKLLYGQFIKTSVAGRPVLFNGPATFANNDGNGGDIDNDGAPDDATPDGICQVCHTQTNYWRADGTRATHNNGRVCTLCHTHRDGFTPGCNGCHGSPPLFDVPQSNDGLVVTPSPTGSATAGAHEKHAGAMGYNYDCQTCHYGGMPVSDISGNNRIQIGFDVFGNDAAGTAYDGQTLLAPYSYQGTNGTAVTSGGSLTCANVYCHSMGKTPALGYDLPNSSPAWNATGPLACDSCHTFPPLFDKHKFHANWGVSNCSICHYGTTTDGVTIADRTRHVNGQYDVIPSGTYYNYKGDPIPFTFTYTYAPNGGTCSNNTCHAQVHIATTQVWPNRDLYLAATLNATDSGVCGTMDFDVAVTVTEDTVAPFTCDYDYDGDGVMDAVNADCVQSHVYGDAATYPWDQVVTVNWTVRDANGTSIADPNPRSSQVVVCPSPNIPPTAQNSVRALNDGNYGAKLTDTSYDPDFNQYGRSGPGAIRIDWGDNTVVEYELPMTGSAPAAGNEPVFTHSYSRGGTYYVSAWVRDNAVGSDWVAATRKRARVTY